MAAIAKTTELEEEATVRYLTPEESREYFDRAARNLVGMSGEEFLRRWDAGEYEGIDIHDDPDYRDVGFLYGLIPLGRE